MDTKNTARRIDSADPSAHIDRQVSHHQQATQLEAGPSTFRTAAAAPAWQDEFEQFSRGPGPSHDGGKALVEEFTRIHLEPPRRSASPATTARLLPTPAAARFANGVLVLINDQIPLVEAPMMEVAEAVAQTQAGVERQRRYDAVGQSLERVVEAMGVLDFPAAEILKLATQDAGRKTLQAALDAQTRELERRANAFWSSVVRSAQPSDAKFITCPPLQVSADGKHPVEFHRTSTDFLVTGGKLVVSPDFLNRLEADEQKAILLAMTTTLRLAEGAPISTINPAHNEKQPDLYKKVQTPFESPLREPKANGPVDSGAVASDNQSYWELTRQVMGEEAVAAGKKAWLEMTFDERARM